MEKKITVIGLCLSCISQITTILVVLLYIWIPKLRKHPGQFVFIQCWLQLFYDLHWITSFSLITGVEISNRLCEWIGGFSVFLYNLGLFYTIIFALELLNKFKNISNIAYYKRNLICHFSIFFTALSIELIIFILSGFGSSEYGTCGINGMDSELVEIFPRIGGLVILTIISVLVVLYVRKPYSSLIWNYCLMIFFVILTWCLPGLLLTLSLYTQVRSLKTAGYLLGCLSGTLVGLARLIDSRLLREVQKKFLTKAERKEFLIRKKKFVQNTASSLGSITERLIRTDTKVSNTTSINCFADIYENLSKKVRIRQIKLEIVSAIFIYFSMGFSDDCDKSRGVCFNFDDFDGLDIVLKESEIRYCN